MGRKKIKVRKLKKKKPYCRQRRITDKRGVFEMNFTLRLCNLPHLQVAVF